MMKALFAACAALSLTACDFGSVASAPAPLEQTAVDEKALTLAAQAVDAAAVAASALVRVGAITPGSDRALAVAKALSTARDAVNAAENARQAGSAADYVTAIARANAAVADIRAILANLGV